MRDTLSNINDLINAAGPASKVEDVEVGGVTRQFTFRRLSFIDGDRIRSSAFGTDGKFDGKLFAGNNARIVAATLQDDDGNTPFSVDAINEWPVSLVDNLATAAQKVNSLLPGSQEADAKNSDATPAVASS